MLAGIQEILIIASPHDLPTFKNLLGDGSYLGIKFFYAEQAKSEGLAQAFLIGKEFLDGAPATLILGDNLFYGHNFTKFLQKVKVQEEGATVFGYYVANPNDYGVVEFGETGKVLSLQEKPKIPKSNYAVPGLYFYDSNVVEYAECLKPSTRGELEITDLNRIYLDQHKLKVELLGRGTAWSDTGNPDVLIEAGQCVQTIEKRQGLKIAYLEEIAYTHGWIGDELLEIRAKSLGKTLYAEYLWNLKKIDSLKLPSLDLTMTPAEGGTARTVLDDENSKKSA